LANLQILRGAQWILFTNTKEYLEGLKNLYIPFDCEFIVVDMSGSIPKMIEVYHVTGKGPIYTTPLGYWGPVDGFSTNQPYFYIRRPDFKGHTFTGIVKNVSEFIIFLDCLTFCRNATITIFAVVDAPIHLYE